MLGIDKSHVPEGKTHDPEDALSAHIITGIQQYLLHSMHLSNIRANLYHDLLEELYSSDSYRTQDAVKNNSGGYNFGHAIGKI